MPRVSVCACVSVCVCACASVCVRAYMHARVCVCADPPTSIGVTSSKKPSLTFLLWVLGPERKCLSELGSGPPPRTRALPSPFLCVAGRRAGSFSLLSVLVCGLVHLSMDRGSFCLFHRPKCPGPSLHVCVPCLAPSPLPPSACACDPFRGQVWAT